MTRDIDPPPELTAAEELQAERKDFDRFIADVLRTVARTDPSYVDTYARFTKQIVLTDAPKTRQ